MLFSFFKVNNLINHKNANTQLELKPHKKGGIKTIEVKNVVLKFNYY